ncbi:MAG: SGNH/GDSL hydrolase family protein [Alphaproteobacteria bacterium]|nr:SGNH/GDSL hydrolase family protein [Alphaproteobacteria bacterium]
MNQFGLGLGLTRARRRVTAAAALDSAPRTLVAIGDSITFQNHGVAARNEMYGYLVMMNAMMGQRVKFDFVENKGVSGDSTAQMVARLSSLNGLGGHICAVLGGTNDVSTVSLGGAGAALVSYTNNIITSVQNNLQTIYTYINNTLNIPVMAFVVAPRSFWGSATAEQITQGKRAIQEINTWIRNKASAQIWVVDYYPDWNNGSDEPKVNYTYDGLHPNHIGAYWMGFRAYDVLRARYTLNAFSLSPQNRFTNTDMSGTGGTVSGSFFTGVLATNWQTSGSGGASANATLSKDTDGKQIMTLTANTAMTLTRRIFQRHTAADLVGKTAYFEIEVSVLQENTGTGIWYNLSAELRNTAELSIGFDRRNTTDVGPWAEMKSFTQNTGRRFILRSPTMTVPAGTTYLDGRLNAEMVTTTGQTVNGQIKIHNAQLVVV